MKTFTNTIQKSTIAIVMGAMLFFGMMFTAQPAQAQTVQELQQMINDLLAQIAQLQSNADGSGGQTQEKFIEGDQVSATETLNVRRNPRVNLNNAIGTVETGTVGQVLDGPHRSQDGTTWWRVLWGNGITGWSAEDWMTHAKRGPRLNGPRGYYIHPEGIARTNPGEQVEIAEVELPTYTRGWRYLNKAQIAFIDDTGKDNKPWNSFEVIEIDGDQVNLSIDVDDNDNWEKTYFPSSNAYGYVLTLFDADVTGWGVEMFPSFDEFEIGVKVASAIETDQDWLVFIPDNGIHLYETGEGDFTLGDSDDATERTSIVIEVKEAGTYLEDILLVEAGTETGVRSGVGEFVIEFDIHAIERDIQISTETLFRGGPGGKDGYVVYDIERDGESINDSDLNSYTAVLDSTADEMNNLFTVKDGNTETFNLSVVVDPKQSGNYRVSLDEYFNYIYGNGNVEQYIIENVSDFTTSYVAISREADSSDYILEIETPTDDDVLEPGERYTAEWDAEGLDGKRGRFTLIGNGEKIVFKKGFQLDKEKAPIKIPANLESGTYELVLDVMAGRRDADALQQLRESVFVQIQAEDKTEVDYELEIFSPANEAELKSGSRLTAEWEAEGLDGKRGRLTLIGNGEEIVLRKGFPLERGQTPIRIPTDLEPGSYNIVLDVMTGNRDTEAMKELSDTITVTISDSADAKVLGVTTSISLEAQLYTALTRLDAVLQSM